MKKILVSLVLLSTAAFSANAASKIKAKNNGIKVDHSMDRAYSSRWAATAKSPDPGANFTLGYGDAVGSYLKGQTWYYGLQNFTVRGVTAVNMNAPYQGGDAPSWDGPVRNNYRNMRAYNESEPLPSNAGSRR